jgi:5-methylthioribose kinase
MRKGIIDGIIYPNFVEDITDFLAITLFKTSSLYLDREHKNKLSKLFIDNSDLCKLTEDFVFTFPYMDNPTNKINPQIVEDANRLKNDEQFKQKVMELKYIFMTKAEAMIHGDLHTGSIMLNQEETYIIDSEFAFMGPMGFDVGAVVANLIIAYCSSRHTKDYKEWLLNSAVEVLVKFRDKFLDMWNQDDSCGGLYYDGYWNIGKHNRDKFKNIFIEKIIKEAIGFAGCKMARRILGIAHVLEVESIEDELERADVERVVLKIARDMVRHYDILDENSIKHLINQHI